MITEQLSKDQAVATSLTVLRRLARDYGPRDFAVRFWDGSTWAADAGQPANFTLVLQHPGALRKMFLPPTAVAFGEAYVFDDFDVEGDILAFFQFVKHLIRRKKSFFDELRTAKDLFGLPSNGRLHNGYQAVQLTGSKRSIDRDRQAISYHFDLSNEFFSLWLDSQMVYTCAYFAAPDDSLEQAQERKLDYVCRKLRLRAGERFLDFGCGWGGLAIFAAKHYGVEAVGVTVSRRQVEFAAERIARAGLKGRCRVVYQDYREIHEPESFDKLACIGMVEHIGERMQPILFHTALRHLRPGGLFLNHGITLNAVMGYPPWTTFARRYVFPDGEVRPIHTTIRSAEQAGFEVRDVESLREHYHLTLKHWVRRLEARREDACRITNEATYRVFRIYLAGAALGFQNGTYNLHQTLLVKPNQGDSGMPLTRADWYGSETSIEV